MYRYFVCMHICAPPVETRGIGSSGTAVRDRCELPNGCWDLNLSPLGRAASAELSLQTL